LRAKIVFRRFSAGDRDAIFFAGCVFSAFAFDACVLASVLLRCGFVATALSA
jgi:hypothetical protein